jgi:hypothetical protein
VKRLGIFLCLLALYAAIALVFSPLAAALQPGRSAIRITQTRISHSASGSGLGRISVDTYHLYNKFVRPTSLGSSIIHCTYLGRGGIRGSGTQWCEANFSLPKGAIVAVGIQRSLFFYNLSVVGGTGIYANVIGTVLISQLAFRRFNLIFALQAL